MSRLSVPNTIVCLQISTGAFFIKIDFEVYAMCFIFVAVAGGQFEIVFWQQLDLHAKANTPCHGDY